MSLTWIKPDISNLPQINSMISSQSEFGCDLDAVNFFLYERKYNSRFCVVENWFLRKYSEKNYLYYGFPVLLTGTSNSVELSQIIAMLKADSEENGSPLRLFFATDTQLKLLEAAQGIEYTIDRVRDLADYLYLQKNLAELPGSKYSKKRGHINQFHKKHEDAAFEMLTEENISKALTVEEEWFLQMTEKQDNPPSPDLLAEKELIRLTLENFSKLNLTGGIVTCDNKPVAMCLASVTNSKSTDIHFEKALMPYAKDGAYAFINQEFAKTITTEYINREEDLGLENLRKAKESYHPDLLLEKSVIIIK